MAVLAVHATVRAGLRMPLLFSDTWFSASKTVGHPNNLPGMQLAGDDMQEGQQLTLARALGGKQGARHRSRAIQRARRVGGAGRRGYHGDWLGGDKGAEVGEHDGVLQQLLGAGALRRVAEHHGRHKGHACGRHGGREWAHDARGDGMLDLLLAAALKRQVACMRGKPFSVSYCLMVIELYGRVAARCFWHA